MDLLDKLDCNFFTTELAKFNIEANLTPRCFEKDCFSLLNNELCGLMDSLREQANAIGVDAVITGILPTIRKSDLEITNLTPLERYDALVKAINRLRGKVYEFRIR